jgi:anti-sigma factor RsiW
MSSCDRIREQLSLYAVGGLSRRARSGIERHLRSCPACASELTALARTGDLLGAIAPRSAPAALLESVRREILARPRPPAGTRLRRTWRLALATAALAVLVVGGIFLRPHQPSAPPVATAFEPTDDDTPAAMEAHLAAQWSTPLADEAAVGLRMIDEEGG